MRENYKLLEDHIATGRLDQAESMARHILDIEPEDLFAQVGLLRLKAAHGQLEEAMQEMEALVEQFPRKWGPLAYLAVFHHTKGNDATAREMARKAVGIGARVPGCDLILAEDCFDAGELDDALDFYERALAENPVMSSAWHGKGKVLWAQGELAMAEDALVTAVQHGPDHPEAWVDLVKLEQGAGAHEVAAENLVLALRAHPGHKDLLALKETEQLAEGDAFAESLLELRRRLYAEDIEGAHDELDGLITEHSDDPRLVVAKGELTLASDIGDIPTLVHELNRLIRADTMSWEPRSVLGRLLLRATPLQNLRMAVAHCEDAWRMSGENPHAAIGLIEAWAASGKRAYARALCTKVADGVGPEAKRARAILAGAT